MLSLYTQMAIAALVILFALLIISSLCEWLLGLLGGSDDEGPIVKGRYDD